MKNIFIVIILIIGLQLDAQDILSLSDAKAITLSNNFGIQIAKNNLIIAENMTEKRLNGYLPVVSANGGMNGNLGNSTQKFSSGEEISTSNAFTWGGNASVAANYTIYDKGRDITLEQLKELLTLSNLELRETVELNLLQVYSNFYQVAQFNENVIVLEEAINISKERLRRVQLQLEYGQGNSLNVLNAKVDIQRDSVNLLNAKANLENAKRNLNVAMGRNSTEDYEITTEVTSLENFDLENLIAQSKNENINVQISRQSLAVNKYDLQMINAEKQATLSAGASYDYSYSDNASGSFIDQSNAYGLAGSLAVNWTLFDGSRKIRRQNAIVSLSNQQLQIDQIRQQVERDIINAWSNYQNSLFVLEVERSAVETNRENFERTEEQLNRGQLNSIDFRQAQLNLLNAQTSLNNANFDARIREIELLQLVGRLID